MDFLKILDFGSVEIDTLTGKEGNDTFSLWGNTIRAGSLPHYLFNGDNDYALITDFNSNEDTIELLGEAGGGVDLFPELQQVEYSLGASPLGLPQGTGIYVENLCTQPDLIAVLQGVSPTGVSLSDSYFQFV